MQDSPVHTKGRDTEVASVSQTDELKLIGATVVYDILTPDGVWLTITSDDMLRGDNVVMFGIVVIVTERVILCSIKNEMFPEYSKELPLPDLYFDSFS